MSEKSGRTTQFWGNMDLCPGRHCYLLCDIDKLLNIPA